MEHKQLDKKWKAVWALKNEKGETGVGVKKGKPQQHAHHLAPGRWKLVAWSDDVRAGKGPCAITITVDLFNKAGDKVGTDSANVKKPNRKVKLAFVVLEEGDDAPARAEINITCGALLKKVKVFATLGHLDSLVDVSKFEPEDALWDVSHLTPRQKAHLASVLAEWPELEGASALTFDNSRALKELQRESEFKEMAFEHGVIRPFLLLASMHPKRRAIWAKTLDLDLLTKPFFGDAHAEAWFMLEKDRKGVQARANLAFKESLNPFARSCNWYEIVERVARKAFGKDKDHLDEAMRREIKEARRSFKQTIGPCLDPSDVTVPHVEELFLRAFARTMLGSFPEQQRQVMDEIMAQDDARELANRMRAAGWTDAGLIRFTVTQALQASAKEQVAQATLGLVQAKAETPGAGDAVKFGLPAVMLFISPIPAIPAFMLIRNTLGAIWGSTPGRLIPVLVGILGQRSWLSLGGIRIEDYYPSLTGA